MREMVTVERTDEKKYFFGRVGKESWKAREMLKKVSDVEVIPTIFGDPYVVFKAEIEEFAEARIRLSGMLWIEILGMNKIKVGHGFYVCNDVQAYEADEIKEFVDPLFHVYLRGAEDVKF